MAWNGKSPPLVGNGLLSNACPGFVAEFPEQHAWYWQPMKSITTHRLKEAAAGIEPANMVLPVPRPCHSGTRPEWER